MSEASHTRIVIYDLYRLHGAIPLARLIHNCVVQELFRL